MILSILRWLGKLPSVVWLILVITTAGGLWLHQHDAQVRANAKAEQMVDSVKVLLKTVAKMDMALRTTDSTAARQKKELIDEQKRHLIAENVLAKRTDTLVASLKATLNEEQSKVLTHIVTAYDARLAEKDSMFAAQLRLTAIADERVARRDTLIAFLNHTTITLRNQLKHMQDQHRGLVKKVIEYIPVVGATVLACATVVPCP